MSKQAIAALLMCGAVLPVWAVNKCTAKDGTVSFQEQPCPTDSQAKELTIPGTALSGNVAKPAARGNGGRSSGADEAIGQPSAPVGLIPLAERGSRLNKTVYTLEEMATAALSCKQKIQSKASDAEMVCNRWGRQVTTQLEPAVGTLKQLSTDATFRDANRVQFDRAYRALGSMETDALVIQQKLKI